MSQGLYNVTQNSQTDIVITCFDPVENRVKFQYIDSTYLVNLERQFLKFISVKCSKFQWIDFMSV